MKKIILFFKEFFKDRSDERNYDYLSKSTDLIDLEYRMKELERKRNDNKTFNAKL